MRSRRALLCLAAMSALTLSAVAQEAVEKEPAHPTHEGELLASCDVCMPISVPRGPMQGELSVSLLGPTTSKVA